MKITPRVLNVISGFSVALFLAQPAFAAETETWNGTLYRNGGHFGADNSDESIENGQTLGTTPTQTAKLNWDVAPQSAHSETGYEYYSGHRYRNGGYFGEENCDDE